ncbi:MAG: S8 family serine peptidase [Magnetococcales bacterium]|nr:S8 family serine peptidase [Magnetococcales bacterium]
MKITLTVNQEDQVERILDQTQGEQRVNVIVQMGSLQQKSADTGRTAADILAQRRMALSARDLRKPMASLSGESLPASLPEDSYSGTSTGVRRSRGSGQTRAGAILDQIQNRELDPLVRTIAGKLLEQIRNGGLNSLDALIKHDIVVKAIGRMAPKTTTRGGSEWKPQRFWTSRSMPLTLTRDELSALSKDLPNIHSVQLNRTLRMPTLLQSKQLGVETDSIHVSTWGVEKIKALSAWGAYKAFGSGVKIGLLDTGADALHPDLKDKIVDWVEFDSLGQPKPGWQAFDSDRHGTHCAGTLVGGNHSGRYIGVAPEAKLAVALVLNGKEGGSDAQVLAGIDWAVDHGVDVISMSLGGLVMNMETPPTYTQAIWSCVEAGIPVVAAIGNEGHQTSGLPGNDPLAFSVGATDPDDCIAGFSGGRTQIIVASDFFPPEALPLPYSKPEVSAPGVGIYSSVPKGKWDTFSGTSMATPHVAGAIALLLSATKIREKVHGQDRAFLIQQIINSSVEELGESGQDHRYGFGRVDALRAIDFAKELGY